jgi:small subunit ribosomal protein S1
MITFSAPNAPCEEEYWESLIDDGEFSTTAAPPASATEIWATLGLAAAEELRTPTQGLAALSWEEAARAMREETRLRLPVVGHNRGGVIVDWGGRQGFVPASHLEDLSPYLDEREREGELQSMVGRTLELKAIEVDPERNRLVLSERATRSDEELRQRILEHLVPGQVCSGHITNFCSFGAFVDLGGMEGLVHISEISWGRVHHPSDLLASGQTVDVYVLNVDRERGRIGLSIKRAQPDPWQTLEERYHTGQIVEAVITNVVDFGAFAQVEDGIEGLIHVSELAEGNFLHARSVVHEGEVVRARILNVDGRQRRLGLSLRQVEPVESLPPSDRFQ